VVPGSALLVVLALQAADAPAALPVSIDRVREALDRPARLTIALPEPEVHFRVEVKERQYFTELPPIDFGAGQQRPAAPFWAAPSMPRLGSTPPLVGVNLLAIGSAINRARRERAEKAAREDVLRQLREFCATTHECEVR
jgi:hypothetical protein